MRYITYIFWLVIILLAVVFVVLNSHSVAVNLYGSQISIYLPLFLLILLGTGAVLGVIAVLPSLWQAKNRNRKLKQRVKDAEQEVKNLREIPIKDAH